MDARACIMAVLAAVLVTAVTAVDRSKFRTCAQSAFCGRSRRQSQGMQVRDSE